MIELFSVYDSAVKRFLDPFVAQTVEAAIRRFRYTVNQPKSDFGTFPEDYTLFHIGSFNPETGVLESNATPHSLGLALSFVESSAPTQE